tara:strand:+ start:202 stop:459 length:258 start_codon:yes stop_codon:yes gene_type:complete
MIEIINVLGIAFLISNTHSVWSELKHVIDNPKSIMYIPNVIIGCLMCLSFWVGLIYTGGNIPLSGFISLIAFCIDKYLISTPIKL